MTRISGSDGLSRTQDDMSDFFWLRDQEEFEWYSSSEGGEMVGLDYKRTPRKLRKTVSGLYTPQEADDDRRPPGTKTINKGILRLSLSQYPDIINARVEDMFVRKMDGKKFFVHQIRVARFVNVIRLNIVEADA